MSTRLISKPVQLLRSIAGYLREAIYYLQYKLSNKTYADYYAGRMDRIVTRNPNWGLNLDKSFQLKFLTQHGLTPQSRFLDYGCGALAAGILFIDYLDANLYTGLDISEKTLEEGNNRIRNSKLSNKKATLIHLKSDDLSVLADNTYDILWAQSVFTHMPPEDISSLLPRLRRLMHKNSVFYASFALDITVPTASNAQQRRFKDWYYNEAFFSEAAENAGLNVTIANDWNHPDDPDGHDRLLKFTPK